MVKKRKPYQTYTKEFKLEAVRLMETSQRPPVEEIESCFQWPIFMKGSRQTSKHNPDLSVIQNREHYFHATKKYQQDPILHWQKPVIREFISLMPAKGNLPGKISPSVEYRSFWWKGKCVGYGCYWYQVTAYQASDIDAGLAVADAIAKAIQKRKG